LGVGSTLIHYVPSGPNFMGEATFGAGLTNAYRYDDRKRLVAVTTAAPPGIVASVQYAYNAANWRQLEAISISTPDLSYFSFDSRHRLMSATDGFALAFVPATTQAQHDAILGAAAAAAAGGTHVEAFGYDAADARVTASETGVPVRNYTYVSGHRIASNGTRAFQFNADGVVESDGRFVYRADARGRIRQIDDAGATITEIEYDALGRPVRIAEAGTPVRTLVYFGNDVYQENEVGVPVRQFTRHPFSGSQVAVHLAGRTLYPIFDPRKNLRALIDPSGNVVEQYRYGIFGSPTILDPAGLPRSTSAFGQAPIFGGHAFLGRSERYLSRRRLLDPEDGLFQSPDPRGYADSPSLYVYVAQNPVDYVDLYGESKSPPSLRADRDVSGNEDDEPWYDNPWWAAISHNGLSAAVSLADEASRMPWLFESFLKPFQRMAVPGQRLLTRLLGGAGATGILRLEDVILAPSRGLPWLFANQGQFARLSMSRLNAILAPIGVVSNAASLYDALFRSQKSGVERFADGTFSAAGLFSSGVGTTALLGAGLNAVGWTGAGSLLIRGAGFLGPLGLVTGSAAGGYAIGQFIDEKLGWHEALADRADRNREIYGEMGLNDTAATIFGGVANLPLVSEAGEGIGWAAFKGYRGASWVGGKAADAYDTVTDWVGYEFCNPFGGCD
jgi:RHS repeat-associated protein